MEWQQAGPAAGLDETISALREGVGRLTLGAGRNRIQDRRGGDGVDPYTSGKVMVDLGVQIRDRASAEICCDVPGRLEFLAGLNEHDGQRRADVHR